MLIGTIGLRMDGGDFFSPMFRRGGQGGVFGVEVFRLSGTSPTLELEVQHKNTEDTTWAVLATFASITTADVYTLDATGIKEELQFMWSIGGAQSANAVHFNILAPMWRP